MANNADRDDDGDDRTSRRRERSRDVLDLGRDDTRAPRRDQPDDEPRRSRREDRDRDDDRPSARERDRHPRDLDDADDDRDERRRRDDERRTSERERRRENERPRGDDKRTDHEQDDAQDKKDPGASDGKQSDGKQNGGKQNGGDAAKAEQDKRRSRRPLILAIVAVVALVGIAGGVWYWLAHRYKIDTDDAYTDGNVVTIAPQVSGQVISLEVNDNQFVHKGDVLVRIDPRQFTYDREQAQGTLDSTKAQIANQKLGVEIAKKNFPAGLQLAKANLESAQANLALQKQNYDRQKGLPKQATTQQEVDSATSNYQQAQAQVDQAEARVTQAEPVQQNIGQSQEQVSQLQGQSEQAQGRLDQSSLNVEWSVVRAPQDGWVTRRNVNAGNYVTSGTQIMSLVTTDVWVTANYKETQLDGMRPGQQVEITVDAYPDLSLRGHVDSLQHGSGSRFSAFPAENATGNFIKIVQRVPVKIVIDSGLKPDEPLPLGVSVVPTVMTR